MSAESAGLKIMVATFDGAPLGILLNLNFDESDNAQPLSDLGKDYPTVIGVSGKVAGASLTAVLSSDVTFVPTGTKGTISITVKDPSGNTEPYDYDNMQLVRRSRAHTDRTYSGYTYEFMHCDAADQSPVGA